MRNKRQRDFDLDKYIDDYKKSLNPVTHSEADEHKMIQSIVNHSSLKLPETGMKKYFLQLKTWLAESMSNVYDNLSNHALGYGIASATFIIAVTSMILFFNKPIDKPHEIVRQVNSKNSDVSSNAEVHQNGQREEENITSKQLVSIDLSCNTRSNETIEKSVYIDIGLGTIKRFLKKKAIIFHQSEMDNSIETNWFPIENSMAKLEFKVDEEKMKIDIFEYRKSNTTDQKNIINLGRFINNIREEIRYKTKLIK